jgi:hypothetical protein
MKRAVSVSIGSSKRDKAVEIELMGEEVSIERIGTDGDMEKAALLYQELDGKVDAFGVGGADLGILVDQKWYTFHSVKPMVRFVHHTPLVDGSGLKNTLENRVAPFMDEQIGDYLKGRKKALITIGTDRWGMTQSFLQADYDCVFGDLMFALDIAIPVRRERTLKFIAATLMPIAGRMPFEWIYPVGDSQDKREPKFVKYYNWATVVAGDRHYVVRYMPERMDGKVIVTNTTTPGDVDLFRQAGVKYLVTTTPVIDGRSFGTNMMEAALVAVSGKNRPLTRVELTQMLDQLQLEPAIQELN